MYGSMACRQIRTHIFIRQSKNYLGSATCAEKVPWQATFFLKQEVDEGNLDAPFDLK